MTGNYKVQSLMYEMQNKRKQMMHAEENPGQVVDPKKKLSKPLRSGDMFGEVSLLFGCRRTATVKAKQYCECAYLTNSDFNHMISAHPVLKAYLIKNILKSYDDELRIFLTSALKEISYFSNISEEILTHISMNMVAFNSDKDSFLINASDPYSESKSDFDAIHLRDCEDKACACKYSSLPLMIIYDGSLCMFINIDSGTEFPLAYISKGAVINAHNFLTNNNSSVSV